MIGWNWTWAENSRSRLWRPDHCHHWTYLWHSELRVTIPHHSSPVFSTHCLTYPSLPSPSSQTNYQVLIISTQHMVDVLVPFIFQTWSKFYFVLYFTRLSIALCRSNHYFLTLFGIFTDWKKITFNFIFNMKKSEQYCCEIYSYLTSTSGDIHEKNTVLFLIIFCRAGWGLCYVFIMYNCIVYEPLSQYMHMFSESVQV